MSAQERIQTVGDRLGYPLRRDELVTALEGDDEALLIVSTMADDQFVAAAELAQRLADALGVPAADPGVSALADDTSWRPDED